MTQFIVVSPGQNDIVASGPQYGVKYTFISNDGSRAVFNDPYDADYVGWLTGISGLDSPEVRENADELVGDDGGVHGDFFYGRRPVVFEGMIEPRPDNVSRNLRLTRLQRVTNAMRQDMTIRWAPEGGTEQTLKVRRQVPLRITGGYMKEFQLGVVAADPRIYGAEIKEQRFLPNAHTDYIENKGTMRTPPLIAITGPATTIEVHNHTTGQYIVFNTGFALTTGQTIVLDHRAHSVKIGSTSHYDKINFSSTDWWEIEPGRNTIALHATGTDANSAMLVQWQDAWV